MTDNKYPDTKYKSAYHYGEHLMQLFINFKDGTFSFLIKKDKFYFVFNAMKEERLKIAKAIMAQLTKKERNEISKQLDSE